MLWRRVCWSYYRYFHLLWPALTAMHKYLFVGEDLSSQAVRVSVLLLASGREISVRSEASLLKSLGRGVIHGILHPGAGCAVKLLFLLWLVSYVLSSYLLGMTFLSSNSWMWVPGASCCTYLSRLSEALICNMKPSHRHFFIVTVMLISLIKIGRISIKNKLGAMLSKRNIFAGLPLLIS